VQRDRLVAELDAIQCADEAASWAHRSLPAKTPLTTADADLVEAGFRAKLVVFGDGRGGRPSKVRLRRNPAVQTLTLKSLEPSPPTYLPTWLMRVRGQTPTILERTRADPNRIDVLDGWRALSVALDPRVIRETG
jgi:hypothetical protein